MFPHKHSFHKHFSDRERPPWLPEDFSWPPAPKNRRRSQFFRRMGCVFFLFNLLTVALLVAAMIYIMRNFGMMEMPFKNHHWFSPLAVGVLALIALGFGLGTLGRTISIPLDEMLSAADRIAEGDYAVRVSEKGPREMRSLARAFNKMAARLNQTNAQRREMLSDITHEIRTPLTVVRGNLEGMLDGIYPADEAHLQSLLEETHIIERLVEDLRTLALAESGAIQLKKEATDLGVLVSDTLAIFQAQADTAGITLSTDLAENLPWVEIDPGRIRQVLVNLLGNALRYTPSGGSVVVRTCLEGSNTLLEIRDNGAGIAESDLPHIFERFYKSTDSGGMGLGLAIAKHLVEAHGGKIEAESKPGQGTTMRVFLP